MKFVLANSRDAHLRQMSYARTQELVLGALAKTIQNENGAHMQHVLGSPIRH